MYVTFGLNAVIESYSLLKIQYPLGKYFITGIIIEMFFEINEPSCSKVTHDLKGSYLFSASRLFPDCTRTCLLVTEASKSPVTPTRHPTV